MTWCQQKNRNLSTSSHLRLDSLPNIYKVVGNFPEGLQWTKPYACTSAFFIIGKLHMQLGDLESVTLPFIPLLKEEEVSVEL